MREVVVVGAGIAGLTVAVLLARKRLKVRVIAECGPPKTTSAAAGAIWDPLQADHPNRIDWAMTSFRVFARLAQAGHPAVQMVDAIEASKAPVRTPEWASKMPTFQECLAADLPRGYVEAWRYQAPVIDMPRYLAGLERHLRQAGGKLRTGRRLTSLDEALAEAPIVVNCTGIGARRLVPDLDVEPVRGRLVVVRNRNRRHTVAFAEHTDAEGPLTYLLPHRKVLVLGGSAEKGESDPVLKEDEVTREIQRRCGAIVSGVADAKVQSLRVGIRPKRSIVRLEHEARPGGHIVHNYGHGGSGVTLSHGCAVDVARIVDKFVDSR